MLYTGVLLMFKSHIAIRHSETGRKSPQIRLADYRREGALQGYHDWQHCPVWFAGYSGNHRVEATTSRFKGSHFDYGKERLVLRRGMGFIRDFPVWLQKVDSVARVRASG